MFRSVAYPGILFGRGSTNSVEDRGQREQGSGGGSPLVRGSGGSCKFVQEISFHIVKFLNFWYFRLFMMTTNLFVIVNVKQLPTVGSFRILLPFSRTSWGVGVLNSAIFKLIRMLEWNTKHFPLNLQSGLTFSNFRDVGVGLNSETR